VCKVDNKLYDRMFFPFFVCVETMTLVEIISTLNLPSVSIDEVMCVLIASVSSKCLPVIEIFIENPFNVVMKNDYNIKRLIKLKRLKFLDSSSKITDGLGCDGRIIYADSNIHNNGSVGVGVDKVCV
jgi:hypothetical protein